VGVKVKVGRGVSEGVTVAVSVGEEVGVTVAGSVGEGIGVAVPVGVSIGVGEAINLTPPHPRSRSARAEIQIKSLFVIASCPRFVFATLRSLHLPWRAVPG